MGIRRLIGAALACGMLAAACVPGVPTGAVKTDKKASPTPTPTSSASTAPGQSPTPAASSGVTPSTGPRPVASAPVAGSYFGRVLGLDGQPVVGATVRGFLISNNGGGVIANNGSGLISDQAGSLVGNYRVLQAATPAMLETASDAEGKFKLVDPQGRPLNLEAVKSVSEKAISFAVAPNATGVTLQLARTGTITGKVLAGAATNLIGVDVFVPGTSYSAKTDAAGQYTLANVPVGQFALYAAKRGLGYASAAGVKVVSDQSSSAPDMTLKVYPPAISAIAPANGGPGLEVTLTGTYFGATSGGDFSVVFGGATAANPSRVDDTTIKVKVPEGAKTGDVVVTVDGIPGPSKPFTVIKSVTTTSAIHDLLPGGKVQLYPVAWDTEGAIVAAPTLSYATSGIGFTVDAAGLVSATGFGVGDVKVSSGSVAMTGYRVNVHDAPAVVSTLAGFKTVSPFDRDDTYKAVYEGVGTGVEFYQPRGLVMGSDDHLYVADQRGVVAKVSQDGLVSTFVGGEPGTQDGTGTAARFMEPAGIALQTGGDFVVVDSRTVRRVTKAGVVTTLAGGAVMGYQEGQGAAARFKGAKAVAVAEDGTLYIADSGNFAIRKVTPGGLVSTLAGGIASTGSNDRTYSDGMGRGAKFANPRDIAIAPDGNLYVADYGAGRIRKVTPDGEVTTLDAYDGLNPNSTDNNGPRALTVGPDGTIYFVEQHGYVKKVTPSAEVVTLGADGSFNSATGDGPKATAGFIYLYGICRDTQGGLFVTEWDYDYVQQRVRKLSLK